MNAIGAVSAQQPPTATPQPRLVQAAHEFEAQLMKELLKPMTDGANMDGNDSDAGSGGILGDFAAEALGQSLSRQGGLGIATTLLRRLCQNETDPPQQPHMGNGVDKSASKIATVLKSS